MALPVVWMTLATIVAAEQTGEFHLPEGFRVELFAGDELAHDIYSMTLDSQGRVVVAGRGYVKTLHDDDGDGRADRASLFAAEPVEGARGMYFDGPDLICTGDGALARYRDRNGDGAADGPRELLAELKQAGDHSANGVVRGPDGWFYVACGNDANVTQRQISGPGSPVTDPRQGVVFRCSPDGRQAEVVAHGFRNPYDLAFNADGALLMVDADGERDQYLPWYSPTRLFDVATGMHHGWTLPGWVRSWNRPPWLFDNVPRLVEIGRGSPTGAVVYRHSQFPARYRGAMFSCCWSLGRIYALHTERKGESYFGQLEVFLEPVGSAGFAPVDLAVGPGGEMYVAIGGRGTRGGVYRIEYDDGIRDDGPTDRKRSPLDEVLSADQPLASWSRARWGPSARELGRDAFVKAVADQNRPPSQRIRAIEILTELFDGVSMETAKHLARDDNAAVKARVAWTLGRIGAADSEQSAELLGRLTHDADADVKRAAWEALLDVPNLPEVTKAADWSDVREDRPRRIRAAAIAVLARIDQESLVDAALPPVREVATKRNAYGLLARLWRKSFRGELTPSDASTALSALTAAESPSLKLEAVRLIQRCMGDVRVEPTRPDVYAGYTATRPFEEQDPLRAAAIGALAETFPSGESALDREIARTLGMLGGAHDQLLEQISGMFNSTSRVEDDIHYLIVLSRLPGDRSEEVTRRTATALARLHHKMRRGAMQPARFWPARVGEAFGELADRVERLDAVLAADGRFGLPEHSLFAAGMSDGQQLRATRKIIAALGEDNLDDWTPDVVRLTSVLPPAERRGLLHDLWDVPALRETVVVVLASDPHEQDRPLLVETLRFGQPATIGAAVDALLQLDENAEPAEIASAVSALRQFSREPRYADVSRSLDRLLARWTGWPPLTEEQQPSSQRWERWLREKHPKSVAELTASTVDLADWKKRLAGIDWDSGDSDRGEKAFQRLACARCHAGNSRLGPELDAVARRFSRDDLFTAILDPNRDVSPAYRLTQVETASGKIVAGQLLYESPESTLVQTGPDTTVRITGEEIISIRKSPLSPMPTGLLRDAGDEDLVDLYAWLRTLGAGDTSQAASGAKQ